MNEQNERYARADVQGGYMYNKSEIDYFKQTQAIDVVSNLMLGDYNKKGSYVLSQGLIDQLVKLKKVYQYSFGATTFCQSAENIGGYGKIDFAIKIRNNNQNGTVTATLQLLETIDRANGYYQNTNTASISNYTAKESNTFIVDMLKFFNVVSKKDEGLLKRDKTEEDINLIIARKRYEELLKKSSAEKIDDINKVLYEKRLKILAKSIVGKKILANFNNETYKINGWFVKEGMPGYYRYLNQILDGLFEVHSAEILEDVALTAAWRKCAENAAIDIAKAMSHIDSALLKSSEAKLNVEIFEQQTLAKQNTMSVEQKSEPAKPQQAPAPIQKPQEAPKQAQPNNRAEAKEAPHANIPNKGKAPVQKQENPKPKARDLFMAETETTNVKTENELGVSQKDNFFKQVVRKEAQGDVMKEEDVMSREA